MGTVEYALLLVLIVVVGIVASLTLGTSVSEQVEGVGATLDNVAVDPVGSQPEGIPAIKESPVAHGDKK